MPRKHLKQGKWKSGPGGSYYSKRKGGVLGVATVGTEHSVHVPRALATSREDLNIRFALVTSYDLTGTFASMLRSPAAATRWASTIVGWDQFRVNKMRLTLAFDTAVNSAVIASLATGGWGLQEYPNSVIFAYDNDTPQSSAGTGYNNLWLYETCALEDAEGTVTYSVSLPSPQILVGSTNVPGGPWVDILSVGALSGRVMWAIDQAVIISTGMGFGTTYPIRALCEWDVTLHQRV